MSITFASPTTFSNAPTSFQQVCEDAIRNEEIVHLTVQGLSLSSSSIAEAFQQMLEPIGGIDAVAWWWDEKTLHIWTVIPSHNRTLQQAIYRMEASLLAAVADHVIDFSVIFRNGRSINEVLPTGAKRLTF